MPYQSNNVPPQIASFSAATSGLVVAAAATDFLTIRGVDGKRITVNRILISGVATSAAAIPLLVVKRSTGDTGGTSTPLTAVPSDTSINTPASAAVLAYTVNPIGLGAAVGNVSAARLILSTASASVGSVPLEFNFERMYWKPITLNSSSELLALNYGGATAAGNSIDLMIAWTEEQV